jgi:hypothetical protein
MGKHFNSKWNTQYCPVKKMDVKEEEEDMMVMQEVQQGRRGVISLKIHYEKHQ